MFSECLRNTKNLLCEYGKTRQCGEAEGLEQFRQEQRQVRGRYRNRLQIHPKLPEKE